LKPEWWGSPLVQEKQLEEKACDKTAAAETKTATITAHYYYYYHHHHPWYRLYAGYIQLYTLNKSRF
jgi:hypothetical protein